MHTSTGALVGHHEGRGELLRCGRFASVLVCRSSCVHVALMPQQISQCCPFPEENLNTVHVPLSRVVVVREKMGDLAAKQPKQVIHVHPVPRTQSLMQCILRYGQWRRKR